VRYRCALYWLPLALIFASAASGRAQESFASERPVEDRLRALEDAVRNLKPASPPVLAGWDDKSGFLLRSADQRFQLRITGQIQADYRDYLDDHDTTDLPTFLVRRARLGIEATVLKYYEFRLLPDFGRGEDRIQDAYLNVRYWDEFQFEAGKFKQPFSIEQLIQDRFVPVIERSLIDQMVPARDVGLMIHGQKLFDDRLDYGVSIFGGVRDGDQDTDGNREGAARIAIRPIDGLQLGIAGAIGEDEGVVTPNVLRTPASVPWLLFADDARPNGLRWRYSPELVCVYGPATVSAQYFAGSQEMRAAGVDARLESSGFYVMATLLVTGEQRTSISQAVDPLLPFDPVEGWFGLGAFELVARVSQLDLQAGSRASFERLVVPAQSANRATELTLGFNWYLNRFVRFQFNWENARFSNPVRLGTPPNGRLDHQNSFLTRFQVVF
jgi:phosphate-selective porin OprO/OprP